MKNSKILWPTLKNKNGMLVELCSFGAGIYQIILPNGQRISLSNENKNDYLTSPFYYGKTVGRHAGRLVVPSFTLKGKQYPVQPFRSTVTSLHGGEQGFSFQNFTMSEQTEQKVIFSYVSADGEEGFPGVLTLVVTYELTDDDDLTITYDADTTKTTICNITNHIYLNLNNDVPYLKDVRLQLNNDAYLDIDAQFLIKGKQDSFNSPFDFSLPVRLDERLKMFDHHPFKGIDHYFFFKNNHKEIQVTSPYCPYQLTIQTSYPGVVVYTFNNPEPSPLLGIQHDHYHSGFTVECQFPPGGIHHPPLEDSVLTPNEDYHHFIKLVFRKR
jgi:aldose 1-epimerase